MKRLIIISAIILLTSVPMAALFSCATTAPGTTPTVTTLGIRNAKLCSDIGEGGDYTVQPDATFDRGDDVGLYFEVPGITIKGVDGKFEVWSKFSELKLFDPNGDIVASAVDIAEYHDATLDEAPNFGWFYAWYETTEEDIQGQYRFEFTVTDELSGATGTGSATFTLK